jgi:hypothetical protein
MNSVPSALALLLAIFAGWVNRQQLFAIEYLKTDPNAPRCEERVLPGGGIGNIDRWAIKRYFTARLMRG